MPLPHTFHQSNSRLSIALWTMNLTLIGVHFTQLQRYAKIQFEFNRFWDNEKAR